MSNIPKTPSPDDNPDRFRTRVRHYHRKETGVRSSWENWIEGDEGGRPKRNWIKIIGVILGLLALAGIGVALYIEMW